MAGTIVIRQLIVMEDAIGSMNMQTVQISTPKNSVRFSEA